MKEENFKLNSSPNKVESMKIVGKGINWYNERRQTTLKGMTPMEYRYHA
ncbi:IS3 family transposase [Pediococcus pentosaceus]|nr:IS3 family transposase [Pediococcus pentosaceus]MBF7130771.1 IS3 family transposase [Pediococcus pentosaceus]MBF7135411.1 IS3 family transposase [Pediococcus pentosaceus]